MSQPQESHELSVRSDADVWDELKRETGFSTYKNYLDNYQWLDSVTSESLKFFRVNLDVLSRQNYSVRARCSFIDLSETRSLSTSSFDVSHDSPHDDSTTLLTALQILPRKHVFGSCCCTLNLTYCLQSWLTLLDLVSEFGRYFLKNASQGIRGR